jgi:hypothetical protein
MKIRLFVLVLTFLITTPVDYSYSQNIETIEANYLYELKSLENISRIDINAEINIADSYSFVRTSGENASFVYDKSCIYKGAPEETEEREISRVEVDCVSGGTLIITVRPGQRKVSFVNNKTGKKGEDLFDSGLIFTNFSTDSSAELLFW